MPSRQDFMIPTLQLGDVHLETALADSHVFARCIAVCVYYLRVLFHYDFVAFALCLLELVSPPDAQMKV
jgi:hypothetical protein